MDRFEGMPVATEQLTGTTTRLQSAVAIQPTAEELAWQQVWNKAKNHFDTVLASYLSGEPSARTIPALKIIFEPLLRRYLSGERSYALLDEMGSVE